MESRDIKTVKGLLVPVEWDQDGQITAIALSMSNERELLIEPSETSSELMAILRRSVRLKGQISHQKEQSSIAVHEYQLLR